MPQSRMNSFDSQRGQAKGWLNVNILFSVALPSAKSQNVPKECFSTVLQEDCFEFAESCLAVVADKILQTDIVFEIPEACRKRVLFWVKGRCTGAEASR